MTENGVSMKVVDAVAVWNAKEKKLSLYLTPFKLEKKHLAELRKDRAFFVVFKEKSPDPRKWQWCPYAEVNLRMKRAGGDKTAVEGYHYVIYGLTKKNNTANLNRGSSGAQKEITSLKFTVPSGGNPGNLQMRFSGRGKIFDDSYSWELAVKCPVLRSEKK